MPVQTDEQLAHDQEWMKIRLLLAWMHVRFSFAHAAHKSFLSIDGLENAFLKCPLKEEVYVAQPEGFVDPDHPEKVYLLRKALYGLKQAPGGSLCKQYAIVKLSSMPTQKHLKEVKRIFKYLKGTINMGLWYPKDSGFELTAFSDADHAGCLDTRKSTSGGIQFLGDKLVCWMSKKLNLALQCLQRGRVWWRYLLLCLCNVDEDTAS
ncbi:retrovirus-related pol polyprotein from transposon TNT 1-94 [Tanacetum coccineum]